MRILHTSDWHLGQSFHDFDREYEHQCFLNWLSQLLVDGDFDLLLLSGDVFDHANPSTQAQKMLHEFIVQTKMKHPKLQMVLTAGNHDSAARLEMTKAYAEALGVFLLGSPPRLQLEDLTWTLDLDSLIMRFPMDQNSTLWCMALPYLRPEDWSFYRSGQDEGDHYGSCMKVLHQRIYERICAQKSPQDRVLAMGHLHLSGGEISSLSERRVYIGGEEALHKSIYNSEIDYVALGHLHKAQKIGEEHVRYSGSPLPLSFSEMNYKHQVVQIDMDSQNREIKIIPIPRFVPLLQIPAQALPKNEVLKAIAELPIEEDLPFEQWPYLKIMVKIQQYDPDLAVEIEEALRALPYRLCKMELITENQNNTPQQLQLLSSVGLEQLQPRLIFNDLLQSKSCEEIPALEAAFEEIVHALEQKGIVL